MRRLFAPLIVLLALAGCARDEGAPALPTACAAASASSVVSELGAAPDPVSLDGTPISDCLDPNASAGDVQKVGAVLVDAAQRLGRERDPLALGYLVGAVRRGASRGRGFHEELARRVEQEATPFTGSPAFERGLRAGRTSG